MFEKAYIKDYMIAILLSYGWNFTDTHKFHTTTPCLEVRGLHYSLTLPHIPAQAECTRTLSEGIHRADL